VQTKLSETPYLERKRQLAVTGNVP